jgi:glutaredoxin
MYKLIFKICLILLFVFQLANGSAVQQQDTLLLFTKPGCSNCHATKQILTQSGISFVEKSLDKDANAAEMLSRMAALGYKQSIYLPVIFLNDKLYHPAYKADTGLVALPLQDVVDTIRMKFQRGELNLPLVDKSKVTTQPELTEAPSDCEVKTSPIYLICSVYEKEEDAKLLMAKLLAGGYPFAGMMYYQNQYRVFTKFYYYQAQADSELLTVKKEYEKAYLLPMP